MQHQPCWVIMLEVHPFHEFDVNKLSICFHRSNLVNISWPGEYLLYGLKIYIRMSRNSNVYYASNLVKERPSFHCFYLHSNSEQIISLDINSLNLPFSEIEMMFIHKPHDITHSSNVRFPNFH